MRAYNSNIIERSVGKAQIKQSARMSLLRPQDSVVYFVGKFGDDEEGKWLFNTLSEEYSVNLKHSESIRNVSWNWLFYYRRRASRLPSFV